MLLGPTLLAEGKPGTAAFLQEGKGRRGDGGGILGIVLIPPAEAVVVGIEILHLPRAGVGGDLLYDRGGVAILQQPVVLLLREAVFRPVEGPGQTVVRGDRIVGLLTLPQGGGVHAGLGRAVGDAAQHEVLCEAKGGLPKGGSLQGFSVQHADELLRPGQLLGREALGLVRSGRFLRLRSAAGGVGVAAEAVPAIAQLPGPGVHHYRRIHAHMVEQAGFMGFVIRVAPAQLIAHGGPEGLDGLRLAEGGRRGGDGPGDEALRVRAAEGGQEPVGAAEGEIEAHLRGDALQGEAAAEVIPAVIPQAVPLLVQHEALFVPQHRGEEALRRGGCRLPAEGGKVEAGGADVVLVV